jgi:DNA-binding NarL/FixJ family response regulator
VVDALAEDDVAGLAELEDLDVNRGHEIDPSTTALSIVRSMRTGLDDLTPREREVLELIVTGARNAEIAVANRPDGRMLAEL